MEYERASTACLVGQDKPIDLPEISKLVGRAHIANKELDNKIYDLDSFIERLHKICHRINGVGFSTEIPQSPTSLEKLPPKKETDGLVRELEVISENKENLNDRIQTRLWQLNNAIGYIEQHI